MIVPFYIFRGTYSLKNKLFYFYTANETGCSVPYKGCIASKCPSHRDSLNGYPSVLVAFYAFFAPFLGNYVLEYAAMVVYNTMVYYFDSP
jgi:hypothetical protein